jgi:hypothetical protein
MRKDEFVEIHGEEAWLSYVKLMKEDMTLPSFLRNNANVIIHEKIQRGEITLGKQPSGTRQSKTIS